MPRRTGSANLPLHPRRAPTSRGAAARPVRSFWFQAFGCVLGFDWHFKRCHHDRDQHAERDLRGIEHELGVYSRGGKGATSRNTPAEISERYQRLAIDSGPLIYASRMATKVDSAARAGWVPALPPCLLFSGTGAVVSYGHSPSASPSRKAADGMPSPSIARPTAGRLTRCIARWRRARRSINLTRWMR